MPFQPVAATAEVELVYSLYDQVIENTYFFRKASDYNVAALTSLADDMWNWWLDNMKPYLSSNISLTAVKATAKHDATGPQFIFTPTSSNAGAVAVQAMPSNNAACISLRTALLGRAFRGRNYVGGMPANVVTENNFTTAWLGHIADAYNLLITDPPATQTYVHVTRVVDHVVQTPTALTNPITTAFFATPSVRTMHRRSSGVGI